MKNPDKIVSSEKGVLEKYPLIAYLIENGVVMDTYNLQAEVFRMVNELEEGQYDHLTGFLLRGPWISAVKKSIIDAYNPLRDLNYANDIAAVALLSDAAHTLKYHDLALLFGDVAWLNFANTAGERYGDALIELIVRYLRRYITLEKDTVGVCNNIRGRLGGDEFVILIKDHSSCSIRHNVDAFEKNLEECNVSEILPHFAEYKVFPRFNIGIATLEEACLLTVRVIEQGLSKGKSPMDLLLNMFVAIADGRTKISKGMSHIPFVVSLLRGSRERYVALKPYVLKGCVGVSGICLWKFVFIKTFCQKKTFDDAVLQYILQKIKKDGSKDPLNALIAEAVLIPWKEKE